MFNQHDYIFVLVPCPHLLLFFSYIFGNSFCTHCPTSLYIIYIIFELEEKNWAFPFPVCNFKLTIVRHVVLSLNPRKNLANTMYRFLRRKNQTEYMDFCGATLSKGRREVIPDDEESVRHYVIYVIGGFNISANWVFATCRGITQV